MCFENPALFINRHRESRKLELTWKPHDKRLSEPIAVLFSTYQPKERKRERKKDRQSDRQTDRQTDIQTEIN